MQDQFPCGMLRNFKAEKCSAASFHQPSWLPNSHCRYDLESLALHKFSGHQ